MDALGGHQTARRRRHGGGGDGASAGSAGGVMWWRPRHSLQKIGLQSWRWIPYPSTSAAARAMAAHGARWFTNSPIDWWIFFRYLPRIEHDWSKVIFQFIMKYVKYFQYKIFKEMFSRAKTYLCKLCKSSSCTIIKLQPWTVIKWFDLGGAAAARRTSHITPNGLGTIHHYLKTSQELFQATILLPCLVLPYCYKAVCSRLDGEKNAEKLPPATAAVPPRGLAVHCPLVGRC